MSPIFTKLVTFGTGEEPERSGENNENNRYNKLTNEQTKLPILSIEQKAIVGNVNLASNRNYNHGAIIRIYMGINKVLSLLNEHGDPSFLFQI